MKDDDLLEQNANVSDMNCDKTQCFLRVNLCAYKGSGFEQGALVSNAVEIMLWTRSACDNHELEIPESSLRSYFVQLPPSCKWEHYIPEDPAVKESYRCPIGFVRGRKPMASALCEASLFSGLRREQWKTSLLRQYIFLVVYCSISTDFFWFTKFG